MKKYISQIYERIGNLSLLVEFRLKSVVKNKRHSELKLGICG